MISAQCDKLRDRAKQLRLLPDVVKAPYVLPGTKERVWLSMRSAANDMERAANTILSLRDKLTGMTGQQGQIDALKEENKELRNKLRELGIEVPE